MRILYHWSLDPGSRQARIALAEAKLKFKLKPINPWEPDQEFMALCPEGVPPCLIDTVPAQPVVMAGARAICEFAYDSAARPSLLTHAPYQRAEARRLCVWFDHKFSQEVEAYILYERIEKVMTSHGTPHPPTLREGRQNLAFHLDYIEWILEGREWLAGASYSLADIAGGAHISCLDFLGEIPWKNRERLKNWYQKFKSRPSFRALLSDKVPGLIAAKHYPNLDF